VADDRTSVTEAAHAVAAAISRRDESALAQLLSPEFVLRSPGGPAVTLAAFVAGIRAIPGEVVFVRLENVDVDVAADSALVTGVQHAQVRVQGESFDERRPFVDWFVREADNCWRLRAALDLPAAEAPPPSA
jgi:ketosteroid isomerase-like protein